MTSKAPIFTALVTAAVVSTSSWASADQSVIKRPGAHPDYVFEAEPHLVLGVIDGPGDSDEGFGPGFRGTIEIVDNGFISSINNTVGIGFGLDWLFYGDHCHGGGRNRNRDCHDHDRIILPVVMQWNFWLSRNWSVFGEPGFALNIRDRHDDDDFDFNPIVFYAGGRFHFNDAISLTMRIGHPTFSVGASFFL